LTYNSDICLTTSVSGVGDKTRDFYIAVYNAKNTTSIGRGKSISLHYRKLPDHGDWWNV